MILLVSLVPFIVLANTVAADPIVVRNSYTTLPLTKHARSIGNGNDLILRDQKRAMSVRQNNAFTSESGTIARLTNDFDLGCYTARVGIGAPATYYNLLVDTGSANLWVGAEKKYVRTKTSVETSNPFNISYGNGSISGKEYTDTVTLAPSLVISEQSIGVALNVTNINGIDGILGIGPTNLTIGTLSPDVNASIPTVTDNLYKNGVISSDILSVYFEPTNKSSEENGELRFGGIDTTKFIGDLSYAPLTTTYPANNYWAVNMSIHDESGCILDNIPCIVDTGTTLIYLPTDSFNRYRNATGAIFDSMTQLLRITPEQYGKLKSLFFIIGGREFELTANAQTWPRSLNSMFGGDPNYVYLMFGDIGQLATSSISCINGYVFLERYYSVYDTSNQRVGFASTQFTRAVID